MGNEWSFGKVKAEVLLLPFLNLMVISFRHIILSMDQHRNFPISFNYKFGIKKAKDPLEHFLRYSGPKEQFEIGVIEIPFQKSVEQRLIE